MLSFTVITNKKREIKNVPTDWSEVTFDKYVQLVNDDDGSIERRIAILVGVDYNLINDLPADDIIGLIPAIAFSYDYEDIIKANVVPSEYDGWYIGHYPWSKLEEAKQVIAKLDGKDTINAGASIVKTYTGQDINQKSILETIGLVNFFLSKYLDFMSVLNN